MTYFSSPLYPSLQFSSNVLLSRFLTAWRNDHCCIPWFFIFILCLFFSEKLSRKCIQILRRLKTWFKPLYCLQFFLNFTSFGRDRECQFSNVRLFNEKTCHQLFQNWARYSTYMLSLTLIFKIPNNSLKMGTPLTK